MIKTVTLKPIYLFCFILAFKFAFIACNSIDYSDVWIIDGRINQEIQPRGIDTKRPGFSWKLKADVRNQYQLAYQIIVVSDETKDTCWNSGKVISDSSIHIKYAGKTLKPVHRYNWKVRVWDKENKSSKWSEINSFSTGIFNEKEWEAQWISSPEASYAPLFLKELDLDILPNEASTFINCQGFFELYVNGKKVGNDVLVPAVSDYRFENYYLTYDIKNYLKKGKNTIGVWTGRGWYSPGLPAVKHDAPVFRLQAHLSFKKDSQKIITDSSWLTNTSNLKQVGIWRWNQMGGELVDDRNPMQDWWNGETDESWKNAIAVGKPEALTGSQMCKANTITDTICVKDISQIDKNVWLVDFGKNFTGWMEMKINNQRPGDTIDFIYSDFCNKKPKRLSKYKWDFGNKYIDQRDAYISSESDSGIFCPKFNYHAFRYVIVQGLNYKPNTHDIKGYMIESDLEDAGYFASSDKDLNAIYHLNDFTFRCLNNGGYFVDCPHRERLGYGGDGQVAIETGIYSFDLYNFYKKWAKNWLNNQDEYGNFGHTAPAPYGAGGGPAWGGLGVVLPWKIYKYYGDVSILRSSYEAMVAYINFLETKSEDGLLKHFGHKQWGFIGDWLPPRKGMDSKNKITASEREVFNNCYKLYLYNILAESADIIGKNEDKEKYNRLAKQLRDKINEVHYNHDKGVYANGGQTYLSFPLLMNIPGKTEVDRVFMNLENEIRVTNNGHVNTGMLGTYFMLEYLTGIGRSDLVYLMMKQKSFPGWGYMIERGANTCWEQWNGHWSNVHACFTSGGGWFYTGVAGIRQVENSVAFKHLLIVPQLTDQIKEQNTYFISPYGKVVVAWSHNEDSELQLEIEIPVNTTADVVLPVSEKSKVYESGIRLSENVDIVNAKMQENGLKVTIPSGKYEFYITE